MTRCVLDSSVALAWVLPGEGTDAVLDEIAAEGAAAPGLWPLEIANVLLQAEKARRITQDERRRALTTLAALPIHIDPDTAAQAWSRAQALALAEAQGLTLYDAAYLELALWLALPLASLDRKLRQAAAASGVELVGKAA